MNVANEPKWIRAVHIFALYFEETFGGLLILVFIGMLLFTSVTWQSAGAFLAVLLGVGKYAKSFRQSKSKKK
jgi:hypothetical protein